MNTTTHKATTELQDRLAALLSVTEYAAGQTFSGAWDAASQRFEFGASAKQLKRKGEPVRGVRVWLQFDDPATLEGVRVRSAAPKPWMRNVIAAWHADAALIAIELVNPEMAAQLRARDSEREAAL